MADRTDEGDEPTRRGAVLATTLAGAEPSAAPAQTRPVVASSASVVPTTATAVGTRAASVAAARTVGHKAQRALGTARPAGPAAPERSGPTTAERDRSRPSRARADGDDHPAPTATSSGVPPFRFVQILCWQIALAALLFGADRGRPAFVTSVATAALLLAPTTLWWHRRWLYRWAGLGLGFLLRSRSRHVTVADVPASVLPGLSVRQLSIDDTPAAVLESARGLATVVVLHTDDPPAPTSVVPSGAAGYTAQIVSRSDLNDSLSHWLVLLARPGTGDSDVTGDLANRTRRLTRRLERTGLPAVAATPDEVQRMLVGTVGLADRDGVVEVRERWNAWYCGGRAHVCALVDDDRPELVADTLAAGTGRPVEVVVSRTARVGEDGRVTTSSVARVIADDVDTARSVIAAIPGAEPIQGRQGPGLRACMPAGPALDIH